MRKIIYYVASSIDGYIAPPDKDISRFVQKSKGIDQYFQDIEKLDTVIMGKNTYEFGYRFGLKPGGLAYPNMEHYIFSNNLKLKNKSPKLHIKKVDIDVIDELKNSEGTDIYLCGGGMFAGWLLDNKKIDVIKIKLNPIILGAGIKMFGQSNINYNLKLVGSESYDNGLQILEYKTTY